MIPSMLSGNHFWSLVVSLEEKKPLWRITHALTKKWTFTIIEVSAHLK